MSETTMHEHIEGWCIPMRAQSDSQPPPVGQPSTEMTPTASTRHHVAGIELALLADIGHLVRGGYVYELTHPTCIEVGPDGDVLSAFYMEWGKRSATELECRLWRAATAAYQANLGAQWEMFVGQIRQFTGLVDGLLTTLRPTKEFEITAMGSDQPVRTFTAEEPK